MIERAFEALGHIAARRRKITDQKIRYEDLEKIIDGMPKDIKIEVTHLSSTSAMHNLAIYPIDIADQLSRFSPTIENMTYFEGNYKVYKNHISEVHVVEAYQTLNPHKPKSYAHAHIRMKYTLQKAVKEKLKH